MSMLAPSTQSGNQREIEVQFTGKNMTPWGGVGLLRKFVHKLAVEKALARHLPSPDRDCKYHPARLLLTLVYSLALGLHRISDTQLLREDVVARRLLQLPHFPHPSTFSRRLSGFTAAQAKLVGKANVSLLRQVRRRFFHGGQVTLDLDSHVQTVYGKQQGASKGYNPKKPGRKSYHPLLCFIGETRDFLWGRFRPGRRYAGQGAVSFLRECLAALPPGAKRIRLRADSSFFCGQFLEELEEKGIRYAIAAKLYRTIQCQLGGVEYRELEVGVAVGEFFWRAHGWERARRLVVIRKEISEGTAGKQLPLIELNGYTYQVIVTNLPWAPEEVWWFYNRRANVENMIKEGVLGYGLDVNWSETYGGNAAHFFLVMLVYNLMNWFRELVLGQRGEKRMAKWIRQRFLMIPGKLVRRGRRWVLKLARDWPWQGEYWRAEERLVELGFG